MVFKEDIVGPEQNGFRSSRTCSDNIFVLNTILEINKSKKKLTHLLFVDLKEAYNRVDRNILISKPKQLNVSTKFINFLTSYYFMDNITTKSTGKQTRKQIQKRGLRQGCNLSSILFIIYMSELSQRMRGSGVGVLLTALLLVCILLFADDIIIMADTAEDLDKLKEIMERWCKDFRMKISVAKSAVVSPDTDLNCIITDQEYLEEEAVNNVSNYKYLGVQQYATPWRTIQRKGKDMITRETT